jgi:hypothetical protein
MTSSRAPERRAGIFPKDASRAAAELRIFELAPRLRDSRRQERRMYRSTNARYLPSVHRRTIRHSHMKARPSARGQGRTKLAGLIWTLEGSRNIC